MQNFPRIKILVSITVSVAIIGLLLWEHFHGGVPSHHLLDQKDLPQVSNWWGALLLPVLTWLLLGRVELRLAKQQASAKKILGIFFAGLLLGIVLAVSFVNGYKLFLDNMLYIILVLCFLVPVFYGEFMLGFVLGMTYTFGAVLPTAFMLIIAFAGWLIWKFLRPLLFKATRIFRKKEN